MIIQPYYMLEFTAISCLIEIRVNDKPVISMSIKWQTSTNIPINYAISESGEQSISIRILPLYGETTLHPDASIKYNVSVYEVYKKFELIEMFSDYKSQPVDKNNPLPIITDKGSFKASIPYVLKDYWKHGKDLGVIDNLHTKLRDAYIGVSEMIQRGDYEGYKKKIAVREHNMAVAMYLTQQESEARFNRLEHDFKNGYDKVEFPLDAIPVYSAYGKKISLKRLDGDPALSFVNEKEMEQQMLDIEFYWSKETNQLEII